MKFGAAAEAETNIFDFEWDVPSPDIFAIGFVKGCGRGNSPKHFEYFDSLVEITAIVYCRFKQIDYVGSFGYADTVKLIL